MPEVQDRSKPGLSFILLDDFGLESAIPRDQVQIGFFVDLQKIVELLADKFKYLCVPDHPVFDDFREAAKDFTIWKRFECIRVDNNHTWLVKSTDQVFPFSMIDARFSADTCINLCKERRRNLDERNPPQVCGRHESGDIADQAATQRYDRASAFHPEVDKLIVEISDRVEILARFPAGDAENADRVPLFFQ